MYLDSGYSNQMIGNKKLFMKLDENVKGTVSFGNDNEGDVMEKVLFPFELRMEK